MTRPPAHPAVPIRGLTIIETLAVVAIAALAATLGSAAAIGASEQARRDEAGHLAEIAVTTARSAALRGGSAILAAEAGGRTLRVSTGQPQHTLWSATLPGRSTTAQIMVRGRETSEVRFGAAGRSADFELSLALALLKRY